MPLQPIAPHAGDGDGDGDFLQQGLGGERGKKAVCIGQITLADGQNAILDNWTTQRSVLAVG